ncbi:hypothetical protein [Krasilnikovia sp. MM14-A1259]|uniref:hypothetical protein n=1 Tax=Krasilnikovia sp. MM14-A1259 TaxID=3373539 RepID=UPI0037FEC092
MSLRRLPPLYVLATAVALLAACDPGTSDKAGDAVTPARVTYTCCSAKDVDPPYRPGQTMSVHWKAAPPDGPSAGAPQVELTARLTGPYASVDGLKAATEDLQGAAGDVTFTAPAIRPSGTPGEQPVSTILIDADARPGYYDLITSVKQGGTSNSGASVIQVVSNG